MSSTKVSELREAAELFLGLIEREQGSFGDTREAKASREEIDDYINQVQKESKEKVELQEVKEQLGSVLDVSSQVIIDLNLSLVKVAERRDRWRERYDSVKATLIQERKQQAMVNSTLLGLIASGAVKVVPNHRSR